MHAAPALHTLSIRKATLKCQHSLFGISHVLAAASSLKHLDVTDCLDLLIRYAEILQASAQLTALICSHRDFYAPDFDNVAQARFFVPSTQVIVSKELPDLCTDWLVHLKLNSMHKWPFAKLSGQQRQAATFCNLRTLHFEACCPFLRDAVQIPAAMKLTEFYLSVRLSNSILIADCTSLRTVGISYSGISRKARLPKSLSKLYWPNALTATPHSVFRSLTNLQSLHLGHASFVSIPQLPSSVTELDLSASKVVDLTSLPTLTNLQKLTLPAAPSSAVLQCLKQAVRLKHVASIERKGELSVCLIQCCTSIMLNNSDSNLHLAMRPSASWHESLAALGTSAHFVSNGVGHTCGLFPHPTLCQSDLSTPKSLMALAAWKPHLHVTQIGLLVEDSSLWTPDH